uniref:PiggyBac transposable element-derived protein domain-containing protein n=1 Tax=Ascaris lumbricoides TaxID=6252 RepID=A0A9J2P6V4_ASCLU
MRRYHGNAVLALWCHGNVVLIAVMNPVHGHPGNMKPHRVQRPICTRIRRDAQKILSYLNHRFEQEPMVFYSEDLNAFQECHSLTVATRKHFIGSLRKA